MAPTQRSKCGTDAPLARNVEWKAPSTHTLARRHRNVAKSVTERPNGTPNAPFDGRMFHVIDCLKTVLNGRATDIRFNAKRKPSNFAKQ